MQSQELVQDYIVMCKVIEAKLTKDSSTFFSSMNVYCEVKFTSTQVEFDLTSGAPSLRPAVLEAKKATAACTGQNPRWQEIFSFNYQKLTKLGQKHL